MRKTLSIVPALLLSLGLAACGGAKAPQTAQEAAELALKAMADGKLDTIRPLLPTKADFLEAIEKSGEKDKGDKIDAEVVELEGKTLKAILESAGEAKTAGLDLATAKVGAVEGKEETEGKLTVVDISAKITSGDKEGQLELRAFKLDRGLILYKKPRFEVTGLCARAIANIKKVTTGVEDEMAKGIQKAFDDPGLASKCEEDLKSKPEMKAQTECMANAKDWEAAKSCMK